MIKITSLLGLAFVILASHGQTYAFASEETSSENVASAVEDFNSQTFGQACTLSWRPVGPRDGVFYNLYRAILGSGEYELRNEEPIPAAVLDGAIPEDELIFIYTVDGTVEGLLSPPDEETVAYLDGGTELYAVYKYKLEAILSDGSSQEFGPVLSKTGFPAAPPKNAFFGVGPTETTGYVEFAVRVSEGRKVLIHVYGPDFYVTEKADITAGDHVIIWRPRIENLPPGEYEASMTLKDYGVERRQVYTFTVVEEPVNDSNAAD